MDVSNRIEHFSFWQPVEFTLRDNPGTTETTKWLYYFGSLADQYASLDTKTLQVKAEHMDAHKIYFEKVNEEDPDLWISALKICSYVLSIGILPALALVIKLIFKQHLNDSLTLTKKSENEAFYEKQFGKTKIVLLFGSITEETTDVIVNAANANLTAGLGVCGAIYRAAGDEPFDECAEILDNQKRGHVDCGEAVLTSAGKLEPKVKGIVHTAGPDYRLEEEKEKGKELLASAYYNSLAIGQDQTTYASSISKKMQSQRIHSAAFPSISTGIFQAPLEEAAPIALKTVKDFAAKFPDAYEEVRFVFLRSEPETAAAYQLALKNLE